MDMAAFKKALEKQTTDFLTHHASFIRNALGWDETDRGVVANGKVGHYTLLQTGVLLPMER